MSSTEFSARITPVERLRDRVKLGAAATAAWGGLVLAHLPFAPLLRGLFVLVWLGWCLLELDRFARTAARVRHIVVLPGGELVVIDPRGHQLPSRLLPGTIMTTSLAWLRFRLPDGAICGEFLCRNAVKAEQWHRLQLIWRQGASFIGSQN